MGIPAHTHATAADAIAAKGRHISLHTADIDFLHPSWPTSGINEATGGGYARVPTTWTSNGRGENLGDTVTVTAPAGTYVEGGIWADATTTDLLDCVGSGEFFTPIIVSGGGGTIDITPMVVSS